QSGRLRCRQQACDLTVCEPTAEPPAIQAGSRAALWCCVADTEKPMAVGHTDETVHVDIHDVTSAVGSAGRCGGDSWARLCGSWARVCDSSARVCDSWARV